MLAAQMLGDVGDVVEPVGLDEHDLHLGRGVNIYDLAVRGIAAAERAPAGIGAAAGRRQIVVIEIKAGIRGLRRGRRAAGAAGTGVVVEFIEIVVILGIGLCQLLQVIHKSHCSVSSRIVIL